MLLLHQSALNIYLYITILASEGFEPSYVMMKTLCLNHLTMRPYIIICLISCPPLYPPPLLTSEEGGARLRREGVLRKKSISHALLLIPYPSSSLSPPSFCFAQGGGGLEDEGLEIK